MARNHCTKTSQQSLYINFIQLICHFHHKEYNFIQPFFSAASNSTQACHSLHHRQPKGEFKPGSCCLALHKPHCLALSKPHCLALHKPHCLALSKPHCLALHKPHCLALHKPHCLVLPKPHCLALPKPHCLALHKPHKWLLPQHPNHELH